MTTINIGLEGHKNILGVNIDKPFEDIKFSDIVSIVKKERGDGIRIQGWVNVTK